jgi:hypothetical protein
VVISILNGSYGGYEAIDGGRYNNIVKLNDELKTLYPDNYIANEPQKR